MTFPEEKPLPDDQNPPENPRLDGSTSDSETLPIEGNTTAESQENETVAMAGADSLENATFPVEPEEPIDLSEIFQAREFKLEDFDPESNENFNPLESGGGGEELVRRRPPTRRRSRPRRAAITRPDVEQLDEQLESMVNRAAPTIDIFIFATVAGTLLGLGFLLDRPAILLFAMLLAPVLTPWAGMILSTATGETHSFGQTLGGMLTSFLLVFVTGLIAGVASRVWLPLTFNQAFLHARFWEADIALLIVGTIAFVVTFIQREEKPLIANIMLVYELFLPISVAGFGLGNNVEGLWPEALLIFAVHLAISLIVGLATYFYMGFRPTDGSGYALSGAAIITSLLIVSGIAGLGAILEARPAAPTPVTFTATATLPIVTAPATDTPVNTPTSTATAIPPTPTRFLVTPTSSPEPTITPLPTPIYGRIASPGDGAVIRIEPAGAAITTVQNGYLVEILPDAPIIINNETWVHVIVKTPVRDINGWMLLNLIATGTPTPP